MKEEPFPPVNVSDGGILVKSPKLSFVHVFIHVVSSLEKVDFVAIGRKNTSLDPNKEVQMLPLFVRRRLHKCQGPLEGHNSPDQNRSTSPIDQVSDHNPSVSSCLTPAPAAKRGEWHS